MIKMSCKFDAKIVQIFDLSTIDCESLVTIIWFQILVSLVKDLYKNDIIQYKKG